MCSWVFRFSALPAQIVIRADIIFHFILACMCVCVCYFTWYFIHIHWIHLQSALLFRLYCNSNCNVVCYIYKYKYWKFISFCRCDFLFCTQHTQREQNKKNPSMGLEIGMRTCTWMKMEEKRERISMRNKWKWKQCVHGMFTRNNKMILNAKGTIRTFRDPVAPGKRARQIGVCISMSEERHRPNIHP